MNRNLEYIIAQHAPDILEKMLKQRVLEGGQILDRNTFNEMMTIYDCHMEHVHVANLENNTKIINLLFLAIQQNQYEVFVQMFSCFGINDFTTEQMRNLISQCLNYRRGKFFVDIVKRFELFRGYPIAVGRELYDTFYIYDDADRSLLKLFPELIYSDAEMLDAVTTSDYEVLSRVVRQAQLDMDKWLEYAAEHHHQITVSVIKRLCGHHHHVASDPVDISDTESTCSFASTDTATTTASEESVMSGPTNPPYLSLKPFDGFGSESVYQYAQDTEIKEEMSNPATPLLFSEDSWKQEYDNDDYQTWFP